MSESCYITFPSIYNALRAESFLEKNKVSFKMVPVPRSISSSCGTAIKSECGIIESIVFILLENKIELDGLYRIEEDGYKTISVEELPIELD